MDENNQDLNLTPQLEKQTNTQIEEKRDVNIDPKTEIRFDDLPNLEDLLKSEKEIKQEADSTPQGLQQIKPHEKEADKIFTKKEDERRAFVKHRVKLFTFVYVAVCALLLGFAIVNTATLITLANNSKTNTDLVSQGNTYIQTTESSQDKQALDDGYLSVNVPRDYGDEDTDLTFFDKLSILFKSLFG